MKMTAGVSFLRLNGCHKCHKYVYTPDQKIEHCPYVKPDGTVCGSPRFDSKGKAFEVLIGVGVCEFFLVVCASCGWCCLFYTTNMFVLLQTVLYFPLKPRLRSLLKTKKYREMCQHEFLRPRNPDFLTDVYDGSAWKAFMGPATYPNDRIGLQYCIDAFPASAEGSQSLKPGFAMNLSLSPTERHKPENMLLLVVIPTSLKDPNVKKYYDFMATYELDDLFEHGKNNAHHFRAHILITQYTCMYVRR